MVDGRDYCLEPVLFHSAGQLIQPQNVDARL
jgi:hypothetical protein